VHTWELAQASNTSQRDRLADSWDSAAAPMRSRLAIAAALMWAGRRLVPRTTPRPVCVPARLSR
jgi:hypothetical protein